MIDWSVFQHFEEREFRPPDFDGPVPMEIGFVLRLDCLRGIAGKPISIHRNGGYSVDGHSPNSLHYKGFAADLHIHDCALLAQAMLVYKHTDLNIGIYPFWNTPGLHVDERLMVGGDRVVWWKDKGGDYHYYGYGAFASCIKDLVIYMDSN